MIILRIFIDKIPDTWEIDTIQYLAAIETLIEVFVLSVIVYFVKAWI
jgi:hypothetical protein